jgi:hypothetical protein
MANVATVDDLLTGLVTYLKAHAGLSALIDTRLYPSVLPEARAFPDVVYQVFTSPQTRYSGTVTAQPYIRFACWSYTHTLSWQVAEQVRQSLEGYHDSLGTVHALSKVEDMRDGRYEPLPAPGIYPVHVYARIWFKEDQV